MSQNTDETAVPPKATLFCRDCGRQGHTADWPERVDPETGGVQVYCPECDATLTTRPAARASVSVTTTVDGAAFSPADD